MNRCRALWVAILLAGGLASPSLVVARDGGGFHGGAGFRGGGDGFRGGGSWSPGGGGYRFSAPKVDDAPRVNAAPVERAAPVADRPADRNLEQGYRTSHPLYGTGSRTPWTGHNISADQFRRYNQGGWSNNRINGSFDNDRFNRQVNLENNFYSRNYGGWNDNWANGGYWGSRPWGYGWYSWTPNTWGWWGGSSLGWGLATLAGAEVITDLVNDASEQQSPVIDVPASNYQLNYATVDSVGTSGADFSYAVAGSLPVKGAANCQQGLLDGQVPSSAAQAQLLNAACQVAYGPDPKGTPLPESLAGRLPGWVRDLLLLALGGGLAVAGWQLFERRRAPSVKDVVHHAPVTSG
jgi:hypothetical protein